MRSSVAVSKLIGISVICLVLALLAPMVVAADTSPEDVGLKCHLTVVVDPHAFCQDQQSAMVEAYATESRWCDHAIWWRWQINGVWQGPAVQGDAGRFFGPVDTSVVGSKTYRVYAYCMDGGTKLSDWGSNTVTIRPKPSITISAPNAICVGGTFNASVSPCDYYEDWDIVGGTILSGENRCNMTFRVNTGATQVKLTVTVVDDKGCETTKTKTINVSNPNCNFQVDTGVCDDATATHTATADQASGVSYNWQIVSGGTIVSGASSRVMTYKHTAGASQVRIKLTVTDGNGCTATCEKTVTVWPDPTCNIIADDGVCKGTTSATASTTASGSKRWEIVSGGSLVSGQGTSAITYAVDANATFVQIRLTITDAHGCTKTCDKQVSVYPRPSCDIQPGEPVCEGGTGSASTTSGPSRLWEVTSGGSIVGSNSGATVSFTASPGATSVALKLTITDENGCQQVCHDSVPVLPNPTCSIQAPDGICRSAASKTATTTSPGPIYYWSVLSGGTLTSNPGSASATYSISPGAQSVTLKLVVTDANGCSGSCEKTILVYEEPSCTIQAPNGVCLSTDGHTASVASPMTGVSYAWSIVSGGTIVGPANGTSIQFNVADTMPVGGQVHIKLTATDAFGCSSTCRKYVPINPLPACQIVAVGPVCASGIGSASANPGMSGYAWQILEGGSLLTGQGTANITYSANVDASQVKIKVTVTDQNGCVASCQEAVGVSKPDCTITALGPVCPDASSLTASTTGGYSSYQWEALEGAAIDSGATSAAITYHVLASASQVRLKVTVTDASGCSSTCYKTVTLYDEPACAISAAGPVCEGSAGNAASIASDNYASIVWSVTGGTLTGGQGSTAITWSADQGHGTVTIQVTVVDANGCSATCRETVTVYETPDVSLIGDEVCLGNSATVVANVTSYGECEGGQGATFTWFAWNGAQWVEMPGESGESITVTPTATGTYAYRVELACGACVDSAEANVVVYPGPDCSISGDTQPCVGESVVYTAPAGAMTYNWFVDGSPVQSGTSNSYTWVAQAGSHVISVVIYDENECECEAQLPVEPDQPTLVIKKWYDLNGNGVRDGTEVPLGGFEFTVYDGQGNAVFSGLSESVYGELRVDLDCGTYRIVETQQTGWVNTTPMEQFATIDLSRPEWVVEFGNDQPLGGPARIQGLKFWDLNHNGANDVEPVIGGFRVLIEDASGTVVADITTVANQSWTHGFDQVGRYTIREIVSAGWTQTYPAPNDGVYEIEVYENSAGSLDWRLLSAESAGWNGSFDFGNAMPMGYKWNDQNADGVRDDYEPTLANVRIIIQDASYQIVHETRTGSDGWWYLEKPLAAGTYYVTEQVSYPWVQTYPGHNGYQITLNADSSYQIVSPPEATRYGLSFGNTRLVGGACPLCVDRIVFQSDRDGDSYDIYTMTLEGGAVGRLTDDPAVDMQPAWNWTGSEVVWATDRDGDFEVYIMDHDGGNKANVTISPDSDEIEPNMACQWITFRSNRDGNWEIYKVDPDVPEEQIRLTVSPASDAEPYWSPDESQIAFQSDRDGNWEIYVMSAEGEEHGLVRVTDNAAVDRKPAWLITEAEAEALRNGTSMSFEPWIVFESDRGHAGQFDLFKINLNTGELIQLTDDPSGDMDAVGMPYCDLVVFESSRDGRLVDIWRMELDGADQRNITLGEDPAEPWFDAIDQLTYWFAALDPGPVTYYVSLPMVSLD